MSNPPLPPAVPLAHLSAAMLPAVLDAAGVAELLRCAPKTVADLARARLLPGLKAGGGWIFPTDALLRHLIAKAEENLTVPQCAALAVGRVRPHDKRQRPLPKLIDLR